MRPRVWTKETVKRAGPGLGKAIFFIVAFGLTTCVRPPPPRAAATAVRAGPACKLDGCCQGHGEVAYLQRDLIVMCTDGSPSLTCDCHQ